MFHIITMNLAFALILANTFMILSDINQIKENHDLCTLVSFGLNLFYVATAAFVLFLAFALFLATTSGIIGGYTGIYLSLGWGLAFLAFGLNVWTNLDLMGDDPRCMIGYENESKYLFLFLVLGFALSAFVLMLIVLCNLHTSALRKRIFVEELSSLAQGMAFLSILFALNWSWFPLAYFKLSNWELPDFYPAFQILNSWIGVFAFIGLGLGSKRFRSVLTKCRK